MVDNTKIQAINKLLHKQIVQRFGVMAVALLVIGSISYFGTHQNQGSYAASVGVLSMTGSSSTGNVTTGNTVTVTLYEDSGTDLVNAVQASVSYDPAKLQYLSMTEGTAFPTIAANSTGTAGIIRVGRATTASSPVQGKNAIVTLSFKVVGTTGTASLNYDSAFSFIVRSSDSVNVLTTSPGLAYTIQLPEPAITSFTPNNGPSAGGTRVTIIGTNFVAGATVTIGGTAATAVTVASATSLSATTAAHASGISNVIVTNPDGQIARTNSTFEYLNPAPVVTMINPATGTIAGGTSVAIAGSNFVSSSVVKFGGVAATTTFVSGTGLIAVAPARTAAGSVAVTVTNPNGDVSNSTITFNYVLPVPAVSSISPASGLISGGQSVTITGTGFAGITSVKFGNAAATAVTVINTTTLTAVTPVASATGTVVVSVTNSSGVGTKNAAFTYTAPAPVVRTVAPTSGTANGGTKVTITGSNFSAGAQVAFGTVAATSVVVVNSTSITANAPANASGSVAVSVTNSDGQKSTLANAYQYLALGDANSDGRVNAIDLSILISHDGQNYTQADFNGDGVVGSADMAILLGRWTW